METNLGQKLREERNKLKMSQQEFSNYLGMERSTYERHENNRNSDLRLECLIKILDKIKDFPLELFIPIEILNRYFLYTPPSKKKSVRQILSKEVSKFVRKVEQKLSKD